MRDITFDAITNTITISRSFYDASKEFGSEEQKQLADIKKEYPHMTIAVKSKRTGSRKSEFKGLTYDYMRRFIRIMDRENIVTFEDVIAHYEEFGYDSGKLYQCVKDWFLRTYPDHKDMIVNSTPIRNQKIVAQNGCRRGGRV